MKTLAFIIALIIVAVGLLGVGRPVVLLWLASRSMGPVQLYVVAAFRVAFGLLLLYVAPRSRAPGLLRVLAFIPLLAGLSTPFIGVRRAPALIAWWSRQGLGVVRLTGLVLLALGGSIAYACAPSRSNT
jgi:hypothetical protein